MFGHKIALLFLQLLRINWDRIGQGRSTTRILIRFTQIQNKITTIKFWAYTTNLKGLCSPFQGGFCLPSWASGQWVVGTGESATQAVAQHNETNDHLSSRIKESPGDCSFQGTKYAQNLIVVICFSFSKMSNLARLFPTFQNLPRPQN